MRYAFVLLTVTLLGAINCAFGQEVLRKLFDETYDSLYYDKLEDKLTLRLFSARKFSDFDLNDSELRQTIDYQSNPRGSIGFGGNYKFLGVNLGIELPNDYDSILGRTQRIDLQTQLNLRKLSVNIYIARYQGYYLQNTFEVIKHATEESYYIRPDINTQTYGVNSFYVFNSERYSNRANFLQNEWQKKSAGSFLLGGAIFYNAVSADSSLIPGNIVYDSLFRDTKYDKATYFSFGGNLGYGFTLVLWNHWFLDLSLLAGLTNGVTTIYPEESSKMNGFRLGISSSYRFGIGYNSERFYVGVNSSNIRSNMPLPIKKSSIGFNTGVIKLIVAYRFNIKPTKFTALR